MAKLVSEQDWNELCEQLEEAKKKIAGYEEAVELQLQTIKKLQAKLDNREEEQRNALAAKAMEMLMRDTRYAQSPSVYKLGDACYAVADSMLKAKQNRSAE